METKKLQQSCIQNNDIDDITYTYVYSTNYNNNNNHLIATFHFTLMKITMNANIGFLSQKDLRSFVCYSLFYVMNHCRTCREAFFMPFHYQTLQSGQCQERWERKKGHVTEVISRIKTYSIVCISYSFQPTKPPGCYKTK